MMSEDRFDVVKDAQNVSCTPKCVNLAGCFQAFTYQGDVCGGWSLSQKIIGYFWLSG